MESDEEELSQVKEKIRTSSEFGGAVFILPNFFEEVFFPAFLTTQQTAFQPQGNLLGYTAAV